MPKGFRPPAQGWRFSANPGEKSNQIRNPEKGCVGFDIALAVAGATPSGLDLLVLQFPRVG
jgi:hypothetical protein